ncbi:MAG: PKD domain-containing protein, partial [Bacteroidota bacterium]
VKSFQWVFGDGSTNTTQWDTITHIYTKAGSFNAKLYVTDFNNCIDSFLFINAASNAILDPVIHIVKKGPNYCFRGNKFVISSNNPGAQICWAVYNGNIRVDTFTGAVMSAPTYSFRNCGTYKVKMYVTYPGTTSCNIRTDSIFDIFGPNAIAENDTAAIMNGIQCQIHDTVYFRSPTPYLHCHNDNITMSRLWNFNDPFAPPCTTDTKNGLNIGVNCNWSKDSMHVWHYYTPGKEACYTAFIYMTDTVRGCSDVDSAAMKLKAPSAHWDSTTNPIRPGVYYTLSSPRPCIGDPITFWFDKVLPECGYDSAWLCPDSACKPQAWLPLKAGTVKITYTYSKTCDSSGWITYGAVVRNGKNNSGVFCYDTAWYHYKIFIIPVLPAFIPKLQNGVTIGKCAPYVMDVNMVDSVQDSIVIANWTFETHSSYLSQGFATILYNKNIIQNLVPPNDSIIHGQKYTSPYMGVVFINITLVNTRGCSETFQDFIPLGFQKDIAFSKTVLCLGDTVKMMDYVRYYTSSKPFWEDTLRAKANLEKLWWDIGDGNGFSLTGHNPVVKYKKPGVYYIRLAMQDSIGCRDTITAMDSISVIGIDPEIKWFQNTQYCAPFFLNLFDSTAIIGNDQIATWEWQFSDNKPRSILQNPQHEFTSNGIFSIKLIVTTTVGCTDSITKTINIKGPQPKFDIIGDTVKCLPLTVHLKNTTGYQLTNWQWIFHDPNNSIFSTKRDTDINFMYSNPGIYKIRLFGQDTIRDPATNTLKTCRAYFPDTTTELPVRSVRVLPRAFAKIIGPDSICPNSVDTFKARCDTTYNKFKWNFGDGSTLDKVLPDTIIKYSFVKSGIYKMMLAPLSKDSGACIDTGYKTVVVRDVKAEFDIDESGSPSYRFVNNSQLPAIYYKWYIGNDLANLFSVEKNPSKVISDTGSVTICLQAFNSQGCWDTTCKSIKAKAHIIIPNVFTPDNNDGMNDAFDIDIVGYTKYELVIYNRWGTEVFISTKDGYKNDGINWNGKDHNTGSLCSNGTYFYIFKYKLINEPAEKILHGTVTIIRTEN